MVNKFKTNTNSNYQTKVNDLFSKAAEVSSVARSCSDHLDETRTARHPALLVFVFCEHIQLWISNTIRTRKEDDQFAARTLAKSSSQRQVVTNYTRQKRL